MLRSDVTDNITAPIIGEISHAEENKKIIFAKESRSVIAEQFRILRTNLDFVITGKDDESRIVMVTSSMSSEGKSFVALNLAASLAVSDKKVVLLEFDMRMPKVLSSLNIHKHQGLSNYIVSQVSIDDVLIPSGVHENLYLIGSGVIPPNPSELILNKRVSHLMNDLGKRFDYIIFDTPPVGLVTDAQLLSRYADASIYIIRQRHTFKNQLQLLQEIINTSKIKNMNVVINGVKVKNTYGYSYGYGYGYGVNGNYSYFGNGKNTKRSVFKKWAQKN
jgi:capsular exopolysaccharide synthesis family protein